jgi:hypothetical protein
MAEPKEKPPEKNQVKAMYIQPKFILIAIVGIVAVIAIVMLPPLLPVSDGSPSGSGPTGPSGSTVVVTVINQITQDEQSYAGQEVVVNGTLHRQKSGSLYFWYVVDSKGFSLPIDYTNEIGAMYDEADEPPIMVKGDIYITDNDRAAMSITEIIVPDYENVQYLMYCTDGTQFSTCATEKPSYCEDGNLVDKASVCGCAATQVVQGDSCISDYEVGATEKTFDYTLSTRPFASRTGTVTLTLYSGVDSYLGSLTRPSSQIRFLDDSVQLEYITPLVDAIKAIEPTNREDQARIATSLIQNIPSDTSTPMSMASTSRYPYEVLYDEMGFCDEKSRLLALVLEELTMGVVLFNYPSEEHMAVGIECPSQYDYENLGYCYIETLTPSIISDYRGNYIGASEMTSSPEVIDIYDGFSFNSVYEEFADLQDWNRLGTTSTQTASNFNQDDYSTWYSIVQKYGIETES